MNFTNTVSIEIEEPNLLTANEESLTKKQIDNTICKSFIKKIQNSFLLLIHEDIENLLCIISPFRHSQSFI